MKVTNIMNVFIIIIFEESYNEVYLYEQLYSWQYYGQCSNV